MLHAIAAGFAAMLCVIPADPAENLLNEAALLLRTAGVELDSDTHFLRQQLFRRLVVEQAKLPADCTGATLKVRWSPADPRAVYHAFVRVDPDARALLVALAVVHEQHHLRCRRAGRRYTANEEAAAMREEVRFLERLRPGFRALRKEIERAASRQELGGGWRGVVETSLGLREQLLRGLEIPVAEAHQRQAHNLILAICNDEAKLAHVIANSSLGPLLTGK
jgi:hypothetical protein